MGATGRWRAASGPEDALHETGAQPVAINVAEFDGVEDGETGVAHFGADRGPDALLLGHEKASFGPIC